MSNISTFDLCPQHLFTAEADIAAQEYLRIVNTLLPEYCSSNIIWWIFSKKV